MAKFSGKIGFVSITHETSPGIWSEDTIERQYYGDVNRISRTLESDDKRNSDINISNEFSIVADGFAYENFLNMRYVIYMGAKWKITNVEVQRPRLILSVGGVYNE